MVSQSVFSTGFNNGAPSQFSGFIQTENVQLYSGIGTGTNVFSGNFLRNTSGGDYGGGGFIGAPQTKTTLTLNNLPSHGSVDLNFLLAIIDTWDGFGNAGPDIFNVTVDNQVIFTETFSNVSPNQSYIAPPGVFRASGNFGFNGSADYAYNLGLDPTFDNIFHTASTLTVEWFASGAGWEGGDNESWAIDNVEVILNDVGPDSPAFLDISDVQILEGNTGQKNAVFNVQLSKALEDKVTVKYSTINGSAKSPSDYIAKQGTLTFNPNQTQQNIVIPIKGDTVLEGNETFSVKLANATNANIADGTGKGTIKNDDVAPPKLSINDVSLFEGNNGTTTAKFTVTLKGKAVDPVKVLYSTANKTAKAGSDFSPKTCSLTFKASNKALQKQTISVSVRGDKKSENNETFFVNLKSATNAIITDSRGVGTIKNDDNNNLFAQNDGLFARGSSVDISRYQDIIGSERRELMTSLDQQLTNSISLINIDTNMAI